MNRQWLAGFIDGEGCLQLSRLRKSIFPRIIITNTNKEILEDIQKKYGGDIKSVQLKDNWKKSHYYRVSWAQCLKLLDDIYPYLKLKIEQANTIFAWRKIRLNGKTVTSEKRKEYLDYCDLLVRRMHFLNKKGPIEGLIDPIALSEARRKKRK